MIDTINQKSERKDLLEKDDFGLYIYAPNYNDCRERIIAYEQFEDRLKLEKIPKWIRFLFGAL